MDDNKETHMNFLHHTPNRIGIQKSLGTLYRMFMACRLLILTLICIPYLPAAFGKQQADVLKPYSGPSLSGIDTSTLTGKVMCGYQGWFNCEGDGAELGWTHWARNRRKLQSRMQITQDPAYLHHDGRPVVAVWGVGFNNKIKPRRYSLADCKDLVTFLKEDGCTVMLGVPTGWPSLDRDALPDPEFHALLKRADIVSRRSSARMRQRGL